MNKELNIIKYIAKANGYSETIIEKLNRKIKQSIFSTHKKRNN